MKLNQSGLIFGLCVLLFTIHGATASEDFATIARRNVFGLSTLKPKPEIEVKPQLPVVTLQGLSALLDRRQALLKIQGGAKPNPTEMCCILGEGQERNGVKILRIDMESGTVWFTNQGAEQVLAIRR
ncbi:MAG: hypothetical protein QM813_04925 [Verrucomicrobiota bacterium]